MVCASYRRECVDPVYTRAGRSGVDADGVCFCGTFFSAVGTRRAWRVAGGWSQEIEAGVYAFTIGNDEGGGGVIGLV